MRNAREMYDHTKKNIAKSLADEMNLLENYISDAADDGDFTVTISTPISDAARTKLYEMGYYVYDGIVDQRDNYRTWIISWDLTQ